MTEINVEEIMREIRAEIKQKGYQSGDLSFDDIPIGEEESVGTYDSEVMKRAIDNLDKNVRVNYYQNIDGNPIKRIFKKIMRKLVKPVMFNICVSQEHFNLDTEICIKQMFLYIKKQDERIKELEQLILEKENT